MMVLMISPVKGHDYKSISNDAWPGVQMADHFSMDIYS